MKPPPFICSPDCRILLTLLLLSTSCTPSPHPLARSPYLMVNQPQYIISSEGLLEIRLSLNVAEGYHIQSNPASEPYLIPVTLTLNMPGSNDSGAVSYPKGKPYRLAGSNQVLSVYDGMVILTVQARIPSTVPQNKQTAWGELYFQACDYRSCFPPITLQFELDIPTHS